MLDEADRVEVVIGPPAHGGHCVARHEGQVIFVRHALPGERVIAEVTELHKAYARADAVEILEPSPDRVTAPCPYAHPNGCGGCDLQHASHSAQLAWKESVLAEQLRRLAKLDLAPKVEPIGADLGWRTRVRYHVAEAGYAGLLKHRSHEVVPIDRCLIAHPAIQEMDILSRKWEVDTVEATAPGADRPHVLGRDFQLEPDGFWQVHPNAAKILTGTVIDFLNPREGERAWDLYGGAGLFSAALAQRGCEVTLVEASASSVAAARRSLTGLPVRLVESTVERAKLPRYTDLVVLDPPRAGAGARVVRRIIEAGPRAVAYVACDPAALARDIRTFLDSSWRVTSLRAFDCFPQTHHMESVALLTP